MNRAGCLLLLTAVLGMVGCHGLAVHDSARSLAERTELLRVELSGHDPSYAERYLAEYRNGYLSGARRHGYLGRVVLGGEPDPFRAAFNRGVRDAGRDRAGRWDPPRRVRFRPRGQ